MAKQPILVVIHRLQPHHQAQNCPVVFRRSTVIFLLHLSGIGLLFNVSEWFIVHLEQYILTMHRLAGPILDASEFPSRYVAHCKGGKLLGNEGQLISMLLVVWAVSFGLNERGMVECEDESPASAESPSSGVKHRLWKTRTDMLLREIMENIDLYGVLRRPTLDGVRVLLLLLPLLEGRNATCMLRLLGSLTYLEAQPLERLAIYEATFSQVQALCVLSASTSPGFEDATIRARIFWYAYTQEGMTTGIRGGRFVLYVSRCHSRRLLH